MVDSIIWNEALSYAMSFYERLVKTMKHKKKVAVVAILCFILMINRVTTYSVYATSNNNETSSSEAEEIETKKSKKKDWPQGPEIVSESAVVMDADTGLVLYDKNGTETNYPASITKILTALVAIENGNMSDIVKFSKEAVFSIEKGSSSCAIDWDEELSLEDCLYGLLLESGNDAANGIAEHVGGTIPKFIDMMNAKAQELGCENSHFGNPHGLSQDDHYTCAYDMALISRAAIRNSEFAKITGTRRHIVEPTNKQKETRYWLNHHKFVNKERPYEGCIGGKTGYTQKSRNTLVTFAKRNNMTLVCVVMNTNADAQYKDTANLLDYGFENFMIHQIETSDVSKLLEEGAFFNQYNTVLSEESPFLFASEDTSVMLPIDVDLSEVNRTITYYSLDKIPKTDSKIIEIGTIHYEYAGKDVGGGKILLNTQESKLPTVIHKGIEMSKESEEEKVEKMREVTSSKGESEERRNLKPIIAIILGGSILLIALGYYFIVERPRKKRRRAYLERRRRRSL